MPKYQSKTIRKAPPHLRNLMKIANDLDTQLNRVRRQIEIQFEIAEEIADTRQQNAILKHQLSERNTPSPTKSTGVDVVLTSGEPEEELPDFSQPPIRGNVTQVCWCYVFPPTSGKNILNPHKEGCPNAPVVLKETE